MTDQPADQPLEIHKIRQDDVDLDAASEGKATDPDNVVDLLQRWAADCQEGTEHPTRKE